MGGYVTDIASVGWAGAIYIQVERGLRVTYYGRLMTYEEYIILTHMILFDCARYSESRDLGMSAVVGSVV
jgi:hypothetical protein